MTKPDHPNGTHRVIEASRRLGGDLLINLQGDEPLILPEQIDRVVEILQTDNEAHIGTLRVDGTPPAITVKDPFVGIDLRYVNKADRKPETTWSKG